MIDGRGGTPAGSGEAGGDELADGFGRRVTYLRLSLTDRCSFRCTYCMPPGGVKHRVAQGEVLTFEEIERIVRALAAVGVRRVRLTGGEPTVRRGVVSCVERLVPVPGVEQVVMTTNGHLLAQLAEPLARAGLSGLNVSLDTLRPDRFASLTRGGELGRVLAGIEAARAAGLAVKTNTVALKGFNDDELGAIASYAWSVGALPRFIEWMPMSSGELYAPGALLEAGAIRDLVVAATVPGARVEAEAEAEAGPDLRSAVRLLGPARYYRLAPPPDGRRFGIISAMSEHFCEGCNRARLTAVGALHTCLAHDDATDLRTLLRAGGTDLELLVLVKRALCEKRAGHGFTRDGSGGPGKHMVAIGG